MAQEQIDDAFHVRLTFLGLQHARERPKLAQDPRDLLHQVLDHGVGPALNLQSLGDGVRLDAGDIVAGDLLDPRALLGRPHGCTELPQLVRGVYLGTGGR